MPPSAQVDIAIIGAGLGGTAAAGLLQRAGYSVKVFEQAPAFSRLGAGIHLGPNVMRVMRPLGLYDDLMRTGLEPIRWLSREWDTGEVALDLPLAEQTEKLYGAPYITVHRGDFHTFLTSCVEPGTIEFAKCLVDVKPGLDQVLLRFSDGAEIAARCVIGADGVNSRVRECLLGAERPVYTGHVAHRAVFPTALLGKLKLDDCTKWWSPDRHIVVYYVTHSRDEIYFVTGVPQERWDTDASWVECSIEELRRDFEGFHPDVQALIDACPSVSKWPLLDRNPLPLWSRDRIVLLGDACHPMKPHMAQGAAMAIEDAAMLVRCLDANPANFEAAFASYEHSRHARTSEVQRVSRENTWLRDESNGDPSWVFSYDVFSESIAEPRRVSTSWKQSAGLSSQAASG